jgi:hypothetical protein
MRARRSSWSSSGAAAASSSSSDANARSVPDRPVSTSRQIIHSYIYLASAASTREGEAREGEEEGQGGFVRRGQGVV